MIGWPNEVSRAMALSVLAHQAINGPLIGVELLRLGYPPQAAPSTRCQKQSLYRHSTSEASKQLLQPATIRIATKYSRSLLIDLDCNGRFRPGSFQAANLRKRTFVAAGARMTANDQKRLPIIVTPD